MNSKTFCILLLSITISPALFIQAETPAPRAAVQDTAAVLTNPLPGRAVLSGFGMRKNPYTGKLSHHNAVDIPAPAGTAIITAGPGRVIAAGQDENYGKFITIRHKPGLVTKYAHLDSVCIEFAQDIKEGQQIGTVGETGLATGPHLHFEVIINGKHADPEEYMK